MAIPRSTRDERNVFLGQWSHVSARISGLQGVVGLGDIDDWHYFGAVENGALEVTQEEAPFQGTTFPRVTSFSVITSVNATFTGDFSELGLENYALLMGKEVPDVNHPEASVEPPVASTHGYIDLGAGCGDISAYFTLRLNRDNCRVMDPNDEDKPIEIEAILWKTRGTGSAPLGSSEDFVRVSGTLQAFDDRKGDYGGSAARPLGYIYMPGNFPHEA